MYIIVMKIRDSWRFKVLVVGSTGEPRFVERIGSGEEICLFHHDCARAFCDDTGLSYDCIVHYESYQLISYLNVATYKGDL